MLRKEPCSCLGERAGEGTRECKGPDPGNKFVTNGKEAIRELSEA